MEKKRHLGLKISFCFSIIIVLATVILMKLALYKDKIENYDAKPSSKCIMRLVSSAALNKETVISVQELKSLLTALSEQTFYISSINNDGIFQVIIPATCYGLNVDFKSDVQVHLTDGNFKLSFSNAKIGKLPISVAMVKNFLGKYGGDNIKIIENEIFMPASWKFKICNHQVDVRVSEFQVKDDSATIKITGSLENLMSIIKEVTASYCCNL